MSKDIAILLYLYFWIEGMDRTLDDTEMKVWKTVRETIKKQGYVEYQDYLKGQQ
jgi:hypothetical protein